MLTEIEIAGEQNQRDEQGITKISLEVTHDVDSTRLRVEGWFDDVASWTAEVILTDEQASELRDALGG